MAVVPKKNSRMERKVIVQGPLNVLNGKIYSLLLYAKAFVTLNYFYFCPKDIYMVNGNIILP